MAVDEGGTRQDVQGWGRTAVTSILSGAVLGPVLLVGIGRWLAQPVDRRA